MERESTVRNRREIRKREAVNEEKQPGRHLQLFVKQLTASICFAMIVWGMCNVKVPKINGYADALGAALRYETDLSVAWEKGTEVAEWIKERFAKEEEVNTIEQ